MRFILLATILLVSSCKNEKETIVNRQQSIKKEMEEVKVFYYKKIDSLESAKEADISSAKHPEIAKELSSVDHKRSMELLRLQKEYDSLEIESKNH